MNNVSFPFSNCKIKSSDASPLLYLNPKDKERLNSIFFMAI